MPPADNTDEGVSSVFSELKALGVRVPKVKKFKSGISKQIRAVPSIRGKMFGEYLNEQEKITLEENVLPKFIFICTSYLRKYIHSLGLFRKAGSVARQKDLRVQLENGVDIQESEPHDIAALLKQWLRELPESLIPAFLQDLFIRCQNCPIKENRITAVLLCCHLLPAVHLYTLKHLLEFLYDVASNSDRNMMGVHNLAVVMAPNIFVMAAESVDKSSSNLVQLHTFITELLINNVQRIYVPSKYSVGSVVLKSNSNFNLSMDVLDYSPSKSKKSRKSAHELLSGLKRFVGQSAVPPDGNPNAGKSAPPSVTKRKACPEPFYLSPFKKQALASSNVGLNIISDNKWSEGGFRKASSGHVRQKSFGLLRRKNRKSQPMCSKPSKMKEISIGALEEGLPASLPEPEDSCVGKSSPLLLESDIDLKLRSTSSKKSILCAADECPSLLTCSPDGCLRSPRSNNLSYNLRSGSLIKRPVEHKVNEVSVSSLTAQHASPEQEAVDPELETDDSLVERDCFRTDPPVVADQKGSREEINFKENGTSLQDKRTEVVAADLKSTFLENKHKIKRLCSLEASRSTREINSSQIGRANSAKLVNRKSLHQQNLRRENSKASDTDKAHVKRQTRASARKGSIVRGRPNTVKTGLPSVLCARYCDSGNTKPCRLMSASLIDNESEEKDLFAITSQSPKRLDSSLVERIRSHSDSKIHCIKTKSSPVARICSLQEPSARKFSSTKTLKNPEKENASVPESPFKTPTVHFKTPETWHSAREFLDFEEAREDAGSNKRESIAMILRNKSGHVQQKVHLYDGRARATPSTGQVCDPWSSREKRSKRHYPLVPPPKFIIPESPLKPSCPLKELTNLSSSLLEPPADRISRANFTVANPQ